MKTWVLFPKMRAKLCPAYPHWGCAAYLLLSYWAAVSVTYQAKCHGTAKPVFKKLLFYLTAVTKHKSSYVSNSGTPRRSCTAHLVHLTITIREWVAYGTVFWKGSHTELLWMLCYVWFTIYVSCYSFELWIKPYYWYIWTEKNSTYRNQYPLWFWHSHLEIQPHEFGGSCLCIPCLLLKIKINTHMKMYMIPKVPSYRTGMVLRLVLTVSVTIYNP